MHLPFLLDFGVHQTTLEAYFRSVAAVLVVLAVIQFRKRFEKAITPKRRIWTLLMLAGVAGVYFTLKALPIIMDVHTGFGMILVAVLVGVAVTAMIFLVGSFRKKLWVQAPLFGVVAMLSLGLVVVLVGKAALLDSNLAWLSDVWIALTYAACVLTYIALLGVVVSFVRWNICSIKAWWARRKAKKAKPSTP